jgi:hypothetical protein
MMSRNRLSAYLAAAAAGLALAPAPALAQSAFAGVVKDTTGAMLPGVTVEAASPALIERVRSVNSDEHGAYKIVDLRPGVYTLTFTLPGFTAVRREGVELQSNFTATINAELKVGAMEETVTVSGSSPVVDVQSNSKAQVLARDILDAVPTAHTIQSVGQLIVGVTLTAPDVGGSQAMQQTYFTVLGSGASGTSVLMDGMIINGLQSDGAVQSYLNDAGNQEMVYQTGGGTADSPTGGVKLNMVPREGGNRFSGSIFLGVENWQSDNFTQFLKDSGVTSVDKIGTYHDFDVTQGGPIRKDKLWFFGSLRFFTVNKPIASTIVSDGTLAGLNTCRAVAGSCAQGIDPQTINSGLLRLTWQVSPRNKFSAYIDRIHKVRGAAMTAGDDQTTTAVVWDSPLYMTNTAKWTSTVSNRLLLEAGYSSNLERYNNKYEPGIEQPFGSPAWFTSATRTDSSAGTRSVAGPAEYSSYPDRYNAQAAASYVTGSHNVKFGFQDSWGPYNQHYYANGDMSETFNAGNPVSVTLYATNPHFQDRLNANLGVYAQDAWTLKRMTVNAGLRWDYLNEQVTGQPAQPGTFAYIPAFDDIPLATQKMFSPRVSVVFDLSGDGKTAVRAGFNKFPDSATTGLAGAIDPANGANVTQVVSWTDLNKDGVAQYSVNHDASHNLVGCVYLSPGCELNFAQVKAGFGTVNPTQYDPNYKRGYINQVNVGISHEMLRGVSVTGEWFRTDGKNISFGSATTPNYIQRPGVLNADGTVTNPSYRAVGIFSPFDGHVITMYDTTAASQPLQAASIITDPNRTSVYNGFDFNFNARLPRGARVFGGATTERTLTNTCSTAVNNPNNLNNCDQSLNGIPWRTQFKLAASVPLPWWDISFSASYQALPGYVLGTTTSNAIYTVTASTTYVVCPGNSAAAGCVVGARVAPGLVTSSLSVPLDAPGTTLTPRTNQLDIGFAKRVSIGRLKLNPKIDLFNALNSSDYFTVRTSNYAPSAVPGAVPLTPSAQFLPTAAGSAFRQPGSILQGRILRLGATVNW